MEQPIKNFEELVARLAARGQRKQLVVVWASDPSTRGAVAKALDAGFVDAVFVGARADVEADEALMRHAVHVKVIDAPDSDAAAAAAVAYVRQNGADILMKGMLNTDNLLRAILHKECGLLTPGEVLTHITVAQMAAYDKLLLCTDVAVIPYPNDAQRLAQVRYLLALMRRMGIAVPRIALTHCSEKVDAKHFPFTVDYAELVRRSRQGEFGECIIDGPMDVKTACSLAAMLKKHIDSPIQGQADALVFPDIEAGNTFYKTISLFAGAYMAGLIVGADVPVVLPSRGDTPESKFYSIALAAL